MNSSDVDNENPSSLIHHKHSINIHNQQVVPNNVCTNQIYYEPVSQSINETGIATIPTEEVLSSAASISISDPNYHAALLEAYNRGVKAACALSNNNAIATIQTIDAIDNKIITVSPTADNNSFSSIPPQQVTSMPMMSSLPHDNQQATNTISNTQSEQRCSSLPDLKNEETKRKKRLERNRNSAKVRRMKKKNLIDSYKNEVTNLETLIYKLQSHQWGSTPTLNSTPASLSSTSLDLLEALSMERIVINTNEKKNPKECPSMIHDLLKQQLDQMDSLLESYNEIMTLRWFLLHSNTELSKEEQEIIQELKHIFSDISPTQHQQLLESTKDIEKEYEIIHTIHEIITTLLSFDKELLKNPYMEETINKFFTIMNHNQMTKFLLWNDYNSDAIDCLDYVDVGDKEEIPNFVFQLDNVDS